MREILDTLIQLDEKKQAFGHVSCFDVPEEYEQMEILYSESIDACKEAAGVHGHDLYKVLKTIASEISRGNINEDCEVIFYTFDDFVDNLVEGYEEDARKLFDELFYFMNSDTRISYIDANYLTNSPNIFASKFLHVICEVVE
ncbi:hypothetical protein JDS99_28425 [Bacillus cereus group sp. N6]|uniref:hypothetical protein n=1 Tax=Bacillus cereus group sp. N6 TaxID=2794583 RepID=UPI0018F5937E|nr:hypothetical protein [Bacillus cereus group sp. N6]MBJ8113479.1 hypothetical protein [Bacillus cereus group sp. N6]